MPTTKPKNSALKKEVLSIKKEFKKNQKHLETLRQKVDKLIDADQSVSDKIFDFMYNDFGNLDEILNSVSE